MSFNEGVYIKSHVYVESQRGSVENKPHLEIHLTIRSKEKEKPIGKASESCGENFPLWSRTNVERRPF